MDFDHLVLRTATNILRLDLDSLPPHARALLTLPMRHGGFGLRRMEATAPAAFLGSLAAAARYLPSAELLVTTPMFGELEQALLYCQLPGLKLPPSNLFFARAARQRPTALQRSITAAIEDSLASAIGGSPALSAHLLSLRQTGASNWFTAVFPRPELTLSNDDFRLAARLRLRLPPAPETYVTHCGCGSELLPDHFLVCRHLMRRSVTSRHAILLQLLVSFLRGAGLQPVPEARTQDGEVPDLRLTLDGCSLLLDLSVTHPASPSALSSGRGLRPLGAARQPAPFSM